MWSRAAKFLVLFHLFPFSSQHGQSDLIHIITIAVRGSGVHVFMSVS